MGKKMRDPLSGSGRQNEQSLASGKSKKKNNDKRSSNKQKNMDIEYVIDDSSDSIDMISLRKSKRYMILGIVMIAFVLSGLFGYTVLEKQSAINHRDACWSYEQKVEQLAFNYATQNSFSSYPAYIEDIPEFANIQQQCPDGGSYTWNPITGEYTCSEHGHYSSDFNKAQSIKTGTITKTLNTNASK